MGLVGLLATILTVLSLTGLTPDTRAEILRRRKQFCENAAIAFSMMAERADIETMRQYMETLSRDADDVHSLAVRNDDGELIIEHGEHAAYWNQSDAAAATDSNVWVQFYANEKPWGRFEVVFKPLAPGWLGALTSPNVVFALIVVLSSLGVFYFYLRIVLKHLDPSSAVPARVREALDTLAEGLLVLDGNCRVVLANRAFERTTGRSKNRLLGNSVTELDFINRNETHFDRSPWAEALEDGSTVTGRLLGLTAGDQSDRTFSVSASPIFDDTGQARGILASFEDVTLLEEKKKELGGMVECLRASSVAIKRQNRELELLASRDPLTGCLNRRSFFERFEKDWNESARDRQPLSVMMVDIDFFKAINDNYGHSTGDQVLKSVGATLLSEAGGDNVVCRYGGEEFAVLLPSTSIAEASLVAERMRTAIESLQFTGFRVTTSIGVSERSGTCCQPQDALDQADKGLYVAKRDGRNRVVRWDQLPTDLVVDESSISRTKGSDADESQTLVPYHAVAALVSALAYRDQMTAQHSRRVADLCVSCAEGLLSMKECYLLECAAVLHDIGKVGVPDHILLKPGPLTEEEWLVMRRNDVIGKEIVRASFNSPQLTEILEHYPAHYGDPTFRPASPVGNRLPLAARILAIADAYDAMTHDRVFRQGCSHSEAVSELRRCAGVQFDPELVERFVTALNNRLRAEPEIEPGEVSKETALAIGVQIERLCVMLDEQDFDSLDAMAQRIEMTAKHYGEANIGQKAGELRSALREDQDASATLRVAMELLDVCRSVQRALIESEFDRVDIPQAITPAV